jgi:ribosomal subunit interface protein
MTMGITIKSRHTDLTDAVRAYATSKAERFSRFYDRLMSVDMVFDEQAGGHSVEIIARADHHVQFIARHADGDPYKCVDAAAKELESQLRRHKEKFRNRKHVGGRSDKQSMGEGSATEL